MCDKIRQMQATIRQEERAKTAEMVTEARKEERAKAAIMENMLKKEAAERETKAREEERTKAAELVTEAREEERAKAREEESHTAGVSAWMCAVSSSDRKDMVGKPYYSLNVMRSED